MPDYYPRTIERMMLASPVFLGHKYSPTVLSTCYPYRLLYELLDDLSDKPFRNRECACTPRKSSEHVQEGGMNHMLGGDAVT